MIIRFVVVAKTCCSHFYEFHLQSVEGFKLLGVVATDRTLWLTLAPNDVHVFWFLQIVSFLMGIIYFGQELNKEGVQNINGALFLFLTNMTFQNVFAVINVSSFL